MALKFHAVCPFVSVEAWQRVTSTACLRRLVLFGTVTRAKRAFIGVKWHAVVEMCDAVGARPEAIMVYTRCQIMIMLPARDLKLELNTEI